MADSIYDFGIRPLNLSADFEAGQEKARQKGLRELAGEYYGQHNPTLGKLAALGGDAAGMQKDMQGQEDRKREQIGQWATMLSRAPKQYRAALYKQMHPQIVQVVNDAPAEYTPDVDGLVESIAATYGSGGDDPYKPMNVSPGGEVVDPRTGRVIHSNQNFAPQKPIWDSQRGGFAMPPGTNGPQGAPTGAGGGFLPTVAPRPDYEAQRLTLAQQAAARADQAAADAAAARRRAGFGTAPPGQRFDDQGSLVDIPGYRPKTANADESKGAAGAAGLVQDAIAYAASDTGVPQEVIARMSPDVVRDLVNGKPVIVGNRTYRRQSRFMTGPITGRIPGAGMLANADLEAYRSSAAGKQARVNNPTGPVTNADFEVGAKSVWGPDKPDQVNADLIFNALKKGASTAPAPSPARPSAPPRAKEGQIVENAEGVRLQLRNGQWQRVN